ncbi:MAG: class I SAM-dependent methyltransferase [Xenococcaceae cyanobacterium]
MLKKRFKNQKIVYFVSGVITTLTITLLLPYFNRNYFENKGVIPQENKSIIQIRSKDSLAHLGSLDSFDITEGGTQAGRFLLEALEDNKKESAKAAIQIYDRLIPIENFGGEYTALKWFADYLLADKKEKANYFDSGLTKEYFEFFAANNFAVLKEYLQRKYKLANFEDTKANRDREAFLEDFILFNNPRREDWEKTSKIMEVLNIKKGQRIADIGSGPGYYSFKFADLVGPTGYVYAVDTVEKHTNHIEEVANKYSIKNIEVIQSKSDNISVPDNQVDLAFLCSLYHIIYLTSMEEVKDRFIESIKTALKPDGSLVIVDNALVDSSQLPYHGPYIAKELVISQLEYYGFQLVKDYQFIPQRYVLVFKQKQT